MLLWPATLLDLLPTPIGKFEVVSNAVSIRIILVNSLKALVWTPMFKFLATCIGAPVVQQESTR